jgi:hypothetical protein
LCIAVSLYLPVSYKHQQYRGKIERRAARQLKIAVEERVLSAVAIDSETARILSLLPMTVRASGYVSREKYWHLPRALAAGRDAQ